MSNLQSKETVANLFDPPVKKGKDLIADIFTTGPVDSQSSLNKEADRLQQTFKGDSQYDQGLTFGSDQNQLRANNQPWTHELGNALGSIALNVIPEVIGNTAAILDFEDYMNQDKEVGNSISRAMQEWKQSINEEVLPIYQPESSDMGTREWWMASGRDLGTSIGGFALTGGAMGIGLNSLGKALSTVKGLSSLSGTGQALGAMIEATTLNHAEGLQSGMQVYDDVYKLKLEEYTAQGLADAEDRARQDAADGAAYTINLNRINIPLNITSGLAFLKNPAVTRNLLKKATTMKGIQNIGLEAAQESLEEAINIVAEDAGIKRGINKEYTLDFDDAVGSAFSEKGLQAMMLGAIGGAGQTSATSLYRKMTGISTEEDARYDNQQAEINKLNQIFQANNIPDTQAVFKNAKQTTELLNRIAQADQAGEDSSSLKNQLLGQQAYNSFQYGTTGILEDNFDKISKLTQDEALSKGLDIDKNSDNFYVTKAQEAKKKLKEFEKLYNNTPNTLVNKDEVYSKKVQYKSVQENLAKLRVQANETMKELIVEKHNVGLANDLTNESDKTKKLQSYQELEQLEAQIKQFEVLAEITNDEINLLQSNEYQGSVKKQQAKVVKQQEAEARKTPKAVNSEVNTQLSGYEKAIASEDLEDIQQAYEALPDELKSDPEVLAKYQAVVNANATDVPESIGDDDSFVLPEATKIVEPTISEPIVVKAEPVIAPVETAKSEDTQKEVGVPAKMGFGKVVSPNIEAEVTTTPVEEAIVLTVDGPSKGLFAGATFVDNSGTITSNPANVDIDYKMAVSPEILPGSEVFLKFLREEEANGNKYPLIGVFYEKDGKLYHINNLSTKNQTVAELDQINKVVELTADGSFVKAGISRKPDNSKMVSTTVDYSLGDVLANMSQNLPDGELVLADKQASILDPDTSRYVSNRPDLDDRITAFEYGKNIPGGSLVMYIKTPNGNVIPYVTQVKKIKDIQLNGNNLLDSLASDLSNFVVSIEGLPKAEAEIALGRFLASGISDYVDLDRIVRDENKNVLSLFKLGVTNKGLHLDYKFNTGNGTEKSGRSTDVREMSKLIGERLFNTKGENLVNNLPFAGSPTYVDFLKDNNIVTTNINVNTPFANVGFNIALDNLQKVDKDVKEEVVEAPVEIVKKPSSRLSRLLNPDAVFNITPDKVVSSQDIENKIDECGTGV